jgi:hypothetical protein
MHSLPVAVSRGNSCAPRCGWRDVEPAQPGGFVCTTVSQVHVYRARTTYQEHRQTNTVVYGSLSLDLSAGLDADERARDGDWACDGRSVLCRRKEPAESRPHIRRE